MIFRSDKNLHDHEQRLVEIFSTLDEKYGKGLVIVLEGLRDERVLTDLGVQSEIIRTQSGRSRLELVDDIVDAVGDDGKVLILTDFDREGMEINRYLESALEPHKIRILRGLRIRIRGAMGNLRCIEEMVTLFKKKDSPEPAVD